MAAGQTDRLESEAAEPAGLETAVPDAAAPETASCAHAASEAVGSVAGEEQADAPEFASREAEAPEGDAAEAASADATALAAETPDAEVPAAAEPGSDAPAADAPEAPEQAEPDAAPDTVVAGPKLPDEASIRLAEALVFSSAEPVTPRGLQRLLPDDMDAEAVLAALRERYAGRGVELVDAADGVMFRTAPDLAPQLRKIIDAPRRLPRVAMETLAIVAYHQPITRPEIEHIRGAALSQQTLDALLELNLIAPKGRRETPGRPTLWGTTPEFLAHFGLKDIRELPRREDLLLEPMPPRPETVTPDLQSPAEQAPPTGENAAQSSPVEAADAPPADAAAPPPPAESAAAPPQVEADPPLPTEDTTRQPPDEEPPPS